MHDDLKKMLDELANMMGDKSAVRHAEREYAFLNDRADEAREYSLSEVGQDRRAALMSFLMTRDIVEPAQLLNQNLAACVTIAFAYGMIAQRDGWPEKEAD